MVLEEIEMFNAYKYLFYRIYAWNLRMWGEEDSPAFNTVVGLSALNGINIMTFLMLIEVVSSYRIFYSHGDGKMFVVVGYLFLFVANSLAFLYKEKYKALSERFKNETPQQTKRRFWYGVIYVVLSFVLFFGLAISGQ